MLVLLISNTTLQINSTCSFLYTVVYVSERDRIMEHISQNEVLEALATLLAPFSAKLLFVASTCF